MSSDVLFLNRNTHQLFLQPLPPQPLSSSNPSLNPINLSNGLDPQISVCSQNKMRVDMCWAYLGKTETECLRPLAVFFCAVLWSCIRKWSWKLTTLKSSLRYFSQDTILLHILNSESQEGEPPENSKTLSQISGDAATTQRKLGIVLDRKGAMAVWMHFCKGEHPKH